jgi:hypothetical protein
MFNSLQQNRNRRKREFKLDSAPKPTKLQKQNREGLADIRTAQNRSSTQSVQAISTVLADEAENSQVVVASELIDGISGQTQAWQRKSRAKHQSHERRKQNEEENYKSLRPDAQDMLKRQGILCKLQKLCHT